MNNQSPWSSYGRRQNRSEQPQQATPQPDFTFGAAREAMRTHEQLKRYLERTMREFNEIRGGRAGYYRIIEDALKPPPRPESIEETLRRLTGTRAHGEHRGRSDPSATV
ncbi:MAG TPA: hypothetical protein VED01_24015 [Burkholderiales bacterium]|nr:hypothetical protein [Burkholderiales bacterium]